MAGPDVLSENRFSSASQTARVAGDGSASTKVERARKMEARASERRKVKDIVAFERQREVTKNASDDEEEQVRGGGWLVNSTSALTTISHMT